MARIRNTDRKSHKMNTFEIDLDSKVFLWYLFVCLPSCLQYPQSVLCNKLSPSKTVSPLYPCWWLVDAFKRGWMCNAIQLKCRLLLLLSEGNVHWLVFSWKMTTLLCNFQDIYSKLSKDYFWNVWKDHLFIFSWHSKGELKNVNECINHWFSWYSKGELKNVN